MSMSHSTPRDRGNREPMEPSVSIEAAPSLIADRRAWVPPMLALHSTMTEVTLAPVPMPMNLLFMQSSISQCFDAHNNPVTCPPNML